MNANFDENFLITLFNNISEGIFYVDKDFKIRFINQNLLDLLGCDLYEVIGKTYHEFFSCVNFSEVYQCSGKCIFEKSIFHQSPFVLETFLTHKSGTKVPVCIRTSPLIGTDKIYNGAVSIVYENHCMYDIVKKLNDLKCIAYTDTLTGLANRRYSEASLTSYLSKMRREGDLFGLLLIDIDYFKKVNDTYGHEAGDAVLISLAKLFQKSFRENDLFGRLGGDEFIVIIENVSINSLIQICEKLRLSVSNDLVNINGNLINYTVSIGATLSKRDDTMASILRRADINLYTSKNSGRNLLTHDLSEKILTIS